MPTMTQPEPAPQPTVEVTGGVDTHKDTHTAAAVDAAGRTLGAAQFPTAPAGYAGLLAWLRGLGTLVLVGIEGTGCLRRRARPYLRRRAGGDGGDRPARTARPAAGSGKSDPVDAEAAARAALAQVPHRHP